ncbi:DUF3152 domain-containing protein [Streptomyces sp. NPDC018964]|uniref:DUF3152 domain-containing protein n=1 Tax=Streptomyces sp. NPDC018964 TaxID=3365058 RepID=UPI0037B4DC43
MCRAGIQQDTGGEDNREVPGGVVVNLERRVKGSPAFDGPIHDHRALIIDHERGHFPGHGHVTCGGAGPRADRHGGRPLQPGHVPAPAP